MALSSPVFTGARRRFLAQFSALALVTVGIIVVPNIGAQAAPNLQVVASGPASVLQGGSLSYTLRACNPSGPDSYNMSLRSVLPVGVTYVSTSGTAVAPRTFDNQPTIGQTTLVWDNIADLQTGVCHSIGVNASVDATINPVGTIITTGANAYSQTDARKLVKFSGAGTVDPTTAPGAGTASPVNTTVIPYRLTKSGGGEVLRGVHSHATPFTLTLTNNKTAPTSNFVVDDFLPPNLEFLGCGAADNTTAGVVEYTGAARLTPSACVYSGALGTPTVSITTLNGSTPVTAADGSTTTPPIGTTWVRWTFPGVNQLAANGVETITYQAAIPLRENRPFAAVPTPPTAASGAQGANLDNNTGPWTEEGEVNPSTFTDGNEQVGTNSARSGASYTGPRVTGAPTSYGDSATSSFSAEDLAMSKTSSGSVIQGGLLTNTLTITTSEYRRLDDLVVSDRLPSGTCPQGMTTPIDTGCTSADPPTITVNGSPVTMTDPFTSVTVQGNLYLATWDSSAVPALASVPPNSTVVVTLFSKVRKTYQGGGAVLTNDDLTNYSYVNGQEFREVPGNTALAATLGGQTDGLRIQDDASAPVSGISLTLSKQVSARASLPAAIPTGAAAGAGCLNSGVVYFDGPFVDYTYGDVACFKLRATVPVNISASGVKIVDFLPSGMRYIPGSARVTPNNTVVLPTPTFPAPGASPQPNIYPADNPDTSATNGGATLEWPIGDINNATGAGEIFEVVIAVQLVRPLTVSATVDLTDNLLKLVSVNTAGDVFPQRAHAGLFVTNPIPTLTKGVDKIERPSNASPTYPGDYTAVFASSGPNQGDNQTVVAFDRVTYRVDITAGYPRDITNVVVWDKLPQSPQAITCAQVISSSITSGGTCVSAPFPHIEWTIPTLSHTTGATLRFQIDIPAGITSGSVEVNTAGINQYENPVNSTDTTYTWIPTTNLDTSLTPNVLTDLTEKATIIASSPAMTKTVTVPTCTGLGCVPDARIGDPVSYVVTADVPRTNIIDGHLLDTVPSSLTNVTWTAKLERNGTDITAGNLLSTSGTGNAIDVGLSDPFANTTAVGVTTKITLTINARVADVVGNVDGFDVVNVAQFSSRPTVGGTPVVRSSPNAIINLTVPIVGIAKAIVATSPTRTPQKGVLQGDTITYELTLANTGTGTAYRTTLNDVVPTNLTPNVGSILVDGAAVTGADSASFSGATLNAVIDQIAGGANKKIRYTVTVDTPVTPSPLLTPGLTNTATLTQYQTLPTDPSNPNIRVITPATTSTQTVYPLAKVGNLVWADVNGNGTRDAGDNGLALTGGVTITLAGTDILGNTVSRTTTSNAVTGAYQFDKLMPSNASGYIITFARPSGLYFSPRVVSTPMTSDTDSDAVISDGKTAAFIVKANDDITTIDAGLYEPAVIGNFVWKDVNSNGIQDTGEVGLDNAVVSITDSSGNPVKDGLGTTIASQTTTGGTGAYSFGALPPGTYQIKVIPPSGYTLSPANRLSNDAIDSDILSATNRSGDVSVIPGQTDNSVDAGFFRAITIGDKIFVDLNANGIQNGGDTAGVNGVTVTLEGAGLDGDFSTIGDNINGTTTTNAFGVYSFTKSGANNTGSVLTPGDYRVTFALPSGYEFSPAASVGPRSSAADSDANATTGLTPTFTMLDGESTTAVDAGVWKRASLGDFVWEDTNANGIQDSGEVGVSGVTVELLDSTGASFSVPVTTTTTGSGAWTFTNLIPADYRVKFTPPTGAGWQFSRTGAGTAATDSNPVPATGITPSITLNSGVNDMSIDAGLYKFATLGDLVWEDVNGDGARQSGDDGVDGVTVELLDNANNPVLNGPTAITAVTAGGGLYSFPNLVPGTYKVRVTSPTGWAKTVLNASAATDATDSDVNRTTGISDPITLVSEEINNTLDAGMFRTSTIGDLVWVDTNGSGVRDAGENGVAGAVIGLVDGSGNAVVNASGTTVANFTTTSTGAYSFTNLWPGTYRVVVVTRPTGYELTTPLVTINGGTTSTDSNIDPITSRSDLITLVSGTTDNTIDVGVARPVVIGNQVWVDDNANGVRDASETAGVVGVTVSLLGAGLDGLFGTADDVTATATTTSGGLYSFTRTGVSNAGNLLVAGDYRVTFGSLTTWERSAASINPPTASDTDSDANLTTGATANFTRTEGQTTTFVDAGMFQRASLGNFVWDDLNANGVQDSGEPGIDNVGVELLDSTGASFSIPVTTTTDSSGLWSFTNLLPADYRVKFTAPSGGWNFTATGKGTTATDSNAALTGITPVITLNSGINNTTIDAGLYKFAALGDFVWDDLNGNGAQDSGEPGIGGVTVALNGTTGVGLAVSASTTTATGASAGAYSFTNLVPGSYTITITLPSGRVITLRDATVDTKDSDINPTTRVSSNVTLTSNETNTTLDAGLLTPATIGNRVWHDDNGDGIQTVGEDGIAGATVRLVDSANAAVLNASGATVAPTTTDANGNYSFTNLWPGTYRVIVSAPTGYAFTDPFVATGGATTGTDSNADATGRTDLVTVISGETNSTIDAGLLQGIVIGDQVWDDANADGVHQTTETVGIGGVTVQLRDSLGAVIGTTSTDFGGNYAFTRTGNNNAGTLLRQGDYSVTFVKPAGYVPSPAAVATPRSSGLDSDADPITGTTNPFTMPDGVTTTHVDAGFYRAASIGDRVWDDTDANGIQDSGEPGLDGITVELLNSAGTVIATQATTGGGAYLFTGLAPGAYRVRFTAPNGAGWNLSPTGNGLTTTDSDANISTRTTPVVNVTSGMARTDIDAGFYRFATLGDRVWEDLNGNGVQDSGEPGVANVRVHLLNAAGSAVVNGAGNAITTLTTGIGTYQFSDLVPGVYKIRIDVPSGFTLTAANVGSNTTDSDLNKVTGLSGSTTLGSGETNLTLDAGVVNLPIVSGYTYVDANNNGVRDSGEAPIGGVVITLTGNKNGGTPITLTATTGADGFYQFANLDPSDLSGYTLTEAQPSSGYLDGRESVGTAGGTISGPNPTRDVLSGIIVTSSTNSQRNNFGELRASSITGSVYVDVTNDGDRQVGEQGISGVVIDLMGTDDLGNTVTATTTTVADGSYSFTGLRPGTYTVIEPTQPSGYLDGAERAGTAGGSTTTNDRITTIVLASGVSSASNLFGEKPTSPVAYTAISGTVRLDPNANGTRETGENGTVGSVTITLRDDTNTVVAVTITDVNGNYSFAGIAVGDYTVVETQPAGYGSSSPNTLSVTAPVGGVSGQDFFETTASLSGHVFVDANANGIFDSGETPLGAVTVRVAGTDVNGKAVSVLTTTSVDGSWLVAGLVAGTYTATEPTQPVGYGDGRDHAGSLGGTVTGTGIGSDAISAITVGVAQQGIAYDFGEISSTTSISGTIYVDHDRDSTRDTVDEAMAGVVVILRDALGNEIARTTTATDGSYRFDNLTAGDGYRVDQVRPTGYAGSQNTTGITISALSSLGLTNQNFGNTLSTLSGSVYVDLNNNGTRDSGEPAISGVTVILSGTDANANTVSKTTLSNAQGAWSFNDLLAGTYTVNETQPPAYIDGRDTAGSQGGTVTNDQFAAIALPAGSDATAYLFGERLNVTSLSGIVFVDRAANGTIDSVDTGLAGVTLTLKDSGGNVIGTTTSNPDGTYSFTNLVPGTYSVTETQPTGYGSSTPNIVSTITVPLSGATDINFGETTGSLSGRAYVAISNDGIRQGSETTAISGVTITLTGTDANSVAVNRTTTTDVTGAYSFTGLLAGTYTVTETQPAGYVDAIDSVGTVNTVVVGTLGNDTITAVTLPAAGLGADYDFAETRNAPAGAFVSGIVFLDRAANGTIDSGDTGLGGWTIELLNNAGTVVATVATAADGTYLITNLGSNNAGAVLPAGVYSIRETQKITHGSSTPNLLSNLNVPPTGRTDQNFGETLSSIAGRVVVATTNDGIADAGETGISGVTLTLTGTDANSVAVTRNTTTGADGTYVFVDLPAGTYTVTETQPGAYNDGNDHAGTVNGVTSGSLVPTDAISGIVLAASVASTGVAYDFGELTRSVVTGATLSGTVFIDRDRSGATPSSGEPGIGGVTLSIYDSLNQLVATTTTATDGSYSFAGLRPGTYEVRETQPNGLGSTTPNIISALTVPIGGLANVNFGEVGSTIAGQVYVDTSGDGVRQVGTEAAIAGVTLTLTGTDANNAAVTRSTTTLADGSYRFDDLLAGTYTVTETQPSAYLDGLDAVGTIAGPNPSSAPGTLGNDAISAIALTVEGVGTGYDFGEKVRPTAAGTAFVEGVVWIDPTNPGIIDSGENGLAGVLITLRNAANAIVATALTGPDGRYRFEGLAPDTYSVTETQPSGYTSTTPDAITGIVLTTTGVSNKNFGEKLTTGTTGTSTKLSGNVWIDRNRNGTIESGEPGLGGVILTLLDSNGNAVATTTTKPDGSYVFTNLAPGTYSVSETQPSAFGSSTPNILSTLTIPAAGLSGVNFGETTATVSGVVYVDADNNGAKASTPVEHGIGGVVLTLSGMDVNGVPVNATTTTAPDGSFSFTGLAAGTYSVAETQPAGYTDGIDTAGSTGTAGADVITSIVADAGGTSTGHLFGENENIPTTVYVRGTVFLDRDRNAAAGPGDLVLAGVTVQLRDAGGNVVGTTTTRSDGTYIFTGLTPGASYTVTEVQPVGYGSSLRPTNNEPFVAPATGGLTGIDFGDTLSSIAGSVYFDADNNGDRDIVVGSPEVGIGGVTITLTGTTVAGIQISRTTTTSPDGSFTFTDLAAGDYTVVETQPAGWTDGLDKAGTLGGGVGNDIIANVILPTDTAATGYLFGERPQSVAAVTTSISGTVFVDRGADGHTANGTLETGEPGIVGVTLILRDSAGNEITRTTSKADGTYSFPGITPGTYTVEEVQPTNYGSSSPNIISGLIVPPTGLTGVNFGETLGAITGTVYSDANNNGVQDSGESGIVGVTITVTGKDAANNAVLRTAVTLADGSYAITDLLPSDATGYTVTETQPALWLDGRDDSSVHGSIANDTVTGVVLAVGEQTPVGRFGELAPVGVGDRVWDDLNGNGIQDSGENGIDGVTVTLTGTDDRGATVSRTTTTSSGTGSAGGWFIDNLRPGNYTVTFTKTGMVSTAMTVAAGTPATDSDADANGTTAPFTLRANLNLTSHDTDNHDVDGGLYTPITLGNYVWRDDNLDGRQDAGEPGISGITVNLVHAGPDGIFGTADDRTTSTITDSTGAYSFTNLAPGKVRVVVPEPNLYDHSPIGSDAADPLGGGADAGVDSNVDPITHWAEVTLVSGTNRTDVDAGLIPKGSLGGRVWDDGVGAGDGIRSANEKGIPGITVVLLYPDGSTVLNASGQPVTAVTDANGDYLFDDIVARSYIVMFAIPNSNTVTKRGIGSPDTDSDIDLKTFRTAIIVVPPLTAVRHIDAGLVNPSVPFLVPPSTAVRTTTTTVVATTTTAVTTTTRRPNVQIDDVPLIVTDPRARTNGTNSFGGATASTTSAKPRKRSGAISAASAKAKSSAVSGSDADRADTGLLALTGSDVISLFAVAMAMVGAGSVLVGTTRRRRRRRS